MSGQLDLLASLEPPKPPVHLVKEVSAERGKKNIRVKCGELVVSKDWPEEATVWGSDVTCSTCLGLPG